MAASSRIPACRQCRSGDGGGPSRAAMSAARTPVTFDEDRPVTTLKVRNTGDRPVQVGSHFHFFEVNRALEFDRAAAFGLHLNIPASTALRFEPGDEREVKLVPLRRQAARLRLQQSRRRRRPRARLPSAEGQGAWRSRAQARLPLRHPGKQRATLGTAFEAYRPARRGHPMATISRNEYVGLFGPTTGDRIRLGDTGLFVEIERDLRGGSGDEIVFGGGKSLREGMGMDNQITRAGGAPDLVITNVTIVDAVLGVVKADVGIKDGRICGIGKAGNPQTMDGITPGLEFGLATDAISGAHLILTAAGIDTHIHFISPQQALCGAVQRHDDADRRRHRSLGRLQRDHGHAGARQHRNDAARLRRAGRSMSASSARATGTARPRWSSRSRPARSASSATRTGARRRRCCAPRSRSRTRWTCRSASTPTR